MFTETNNAQTFISAWESIISSRNGRLSPWEIEVENTQSWDRREEYYWKIKQKFSITSRLEHLPYNV